jgi:ubiquinone/menaquinone biosynthesis C-methylase UbiE
MRALYDGLGSLHDPGVRYALAAAQGMSEETLRRRLMGWLDLDGLDAAWDRGPARVLEVGVGTGANLPYLAAALPPEREAVVWGVDLSRTMLARCARTARKVGVEVRLAVADAHALPFADGSFDRVFHVGGIGSYRDRRLALAEMARVARPGTPIVVVDEELSRGMEHGVLAHLAFRAVTFNQWRPRAPLDDLPAEAREVEVEALSSFYYVLRFTCPG